MSEFFSSSATIFGNYYRHRRSHSRHSGNAEATSGVVTTMMHYLQSANEPQLNLSGEDYLQQMYRQQQISMPSISEEADATTIPNVEHTNITIDHSELTLFNTQNVLIIVFYSLIILVSLTGNLLVCRVAFGSRDMRTTTNLLIASLACSDIVMTGKL